MFLHADSEDSDAQADLSLRWAHSQFVGFVMRQLIYRVHHESAANPKFDSKSFFIMM